MTIVRMTQEVVKQLKELPEYLVNRIVEFLRYKILMTHNPRVEGTALTGLLSGIWCYRLVGYKLLADIQGECVTIFAIHKDRRLLSYG